ncbi:IS30 family transposase [Chromohalobacter israelensis]|uniref:IS30 family transposase n=1 Tax=Chromohalobacter israelensis TaxID=141390 RepID=UPI000D70DD02|nr:IS30 family transposase [Chromohalobacter salexigens]MBZ5877443.1 IS30 family transposase [Chromohalobacter salexigens]PWW32666.1 IS30 family transposase [Chromohalobacter salexigens]
MGYRQLTQIQRYQIHARYDVGKSQRQIGRELGLHSSTISRELRRNATASGYDPEQAQARSDHRRRTAWKWTKRLPSMIAAVADRLREEWSPEQISGFMAPLVGIGVSHQWIYSLIWDDKARGGDLWHYLRQPKRRSKHRAQAKSAGLGKIPNRVGIEHRPAAVNDRRFIGHWEGDTVIQGHKQSGLVTLVERRSGYLLAARLPKISAKLTKAAMIRLLKPHRGAVQTITLDNGSEFADHEAVAKAVTATTYFCDPYCSGQRGTNENTNGLIRQYFPKGTDFRQVTDAKLRKVVKNLNDRPRKRLGYRTPAQVFLGEYSGALNTAGAALIA